MKHPHAKYLNSHMYVLMYEDFSLPERHQKPFFRICLTSAQLRSRFGDEKRVGEKVRSRSPRLRWKDKAHRHLLAAGHATDWFRLAPDRRCWKEEIVNVGISKEA